jgi:chromosome segregation ATPase
MMSEKVEQKLDTLSNEVGSLREEFSNEVGSLREEFGSLREEFCSFREEFTERFEQVDKRFDRLESELKSTRQQLLAAINSEIARAVGFAEERFVELFGLLDEKYGGVTKELRSDLDAHIANKIVHVT